MGLRGIKADQDSVELGADQLDGVAGGRTHYAGKLYGYSAYEVIDDVSGEVLVLFDGPDAFALAKAKCEELGLSPDNITDNQLDALRYRYKKGK